MNVQDPPANPIYGLVAAVLLLLAVMVIVLYRQSKQKNDILEKLREAMQFGDSTISFAHLTLLAAILTFLGTALLLVASLLKQ